MRSISFQLPRFTRQATRSFIKHQLLGKLVSKKENGGFLSRIWHQKRGLLKEFKDMDLAKLKRPFERHNRLKYLTVSHSGTSLVSLYSKRPSAAYILLYHPNRA